MLKKSKYFFWSPCFHSKLSSTCPNYALDAIMMKMKPTILYIQESDASHDDYEKYIRLCQQVRRTVFIEGQGVSESIDFDGKDTSSSHLLLLLEGKAAGTLRIRKTEEGIKLERIAVLEACRGMKLGQLMVRCALGLVCGRIYIHAQIRSAGFYEKLGFITEDPTIYYEADIPHKTMIWPEKTLGALPCNITRL